MMRKLIKYTTGMNYLRFIYKKNTRNILYRNILILLLMISLGSCILFGYGEIKDRYGYTVFIKNGTKDTIFLKTSSDSTQIDINDFLYNDKLLPDSIVNIADVSSEDPNSDPIQEYLDAYNIETYVVHKDGVILKKWLKDRDKTGHSPYNPESWEIKRTTDPDVSGWIKFTIEESDLEK